MDLSELYEFTESSSKYEVLLKKENEIPVLQIVSCWEDKGASFRVIYHVIPWQANDKIPVLYFNVYHNDDQLTDINDIYEFVVPKDLVSSLRDPKDSLLNEIAISQGEHPTTGLPTFFLHPCQTEKFLSELSKENTSNRALILWLQTFGHCVSLKFSVT